MLIQAGAGVVIGLAVAGFLQVLLHLHHERAMHRFRRQLRQVELVVTIWEQSASVGDPRRAQPRHPDGDAA